MPEDDCIIKLAELFREGKSICTIGQPAAAKSYIHGGDFESIALTPENARPALGILQSRRFIKSLSIILTQPVKTCYFEIEASVVDGASAILAERNKPTNYRKKWIEWIDHNPYLAAGYLAVAFVGSSVFGGIIKTIWDVYKSGK